MLEVGHHYKKGAARRVLERLVASTPVDTSQALSNWQVGTASTGPIMAPIPPHFSGQAGSTAVASAASTLKAGEWLIRFAPSRYPIVISNVVDYIGELAYPPYKSPQATGDWVGRAIAVGLRQGVAETNKKVVW